MPSHPLDGIMSTKSHRAWSIATKIASQRDFYLAGGTGLALHLHHRQSTDLDFFLHAPFDPQEILDELQSHNLPVAVLNMSHGTLNALYDSVLVQFLSVEGQSQLSPTSSVDTAEIAAIPDIFAMKLRAVTGRAKLRDYFDLMVIDQQSGYPIEQGISFYLERYHPSVPEQSTMTLILSLGYLDDVVDDETVPVNRKVVADFWQARSVELAQNLDRNGSFGQDQDPPEAPNKDQTPRMRFGKGIR